MKQPFIFPAIGFCAGCLAGPVIQDKIPVWFFIQAAAFLCPILYFLRKNKFFMPGLFVVWILLGIFQSLSEQRQNKTNGFSEICQGYSMAGNSACARVTLTGRVLTLPEVSTKGRKQTASWILKAETLNRWTQDRCEGEQINERVQVFMFQPASLPVPGSRILIRGDLESIKPLANPGGFDYGRYLLNHNISATLISYGNKFREFSETPADWNSFIGKIQFFLRKQIKELYPDQDARALFEALILGTKKGINSDLRTRFFKTGTSHLLAISGLNIALLAGGLYMIFLGIGISQKKAALAAMAAAWLETFAAGGGAPVIRASIMASLAFGGILFEREKASINALWFALLVMLAADTKMAGDISFQLSFLSLFFLLKAPEFLPLPKKWMDLFGGSIAVLAGTFPMTIWHFQTFSPVSILANLLAIPLFHLAQISGMAALSLSIIKPLALLPAMLSTVCLKVAVIWIGISADLPFSFFYIPKPAPILILFYYVTLFFVAASFRGQSWRIRILTLFLWFLCLANFGRSQSVETELTFFLAGKNEIAYFQEKNKEWLLNAGSLFPSDQASKIIEPFLRSRGIKKVSGVILTDAKKKHAAGLETLQRNFTIQKIYGPKAILDSIAHGNSNRESMRGGEVSSANPFVLIKNLRASAVYGLRSSGFSVVFLPEISASAMGGFAYAFRDWTEARLLFLASGKQGDPELWENLFEFMDPEWVISPETNSELESFLKNRDIGFLPLEKTGALTFKMNSRDKTVLIQSFRLGQLGVLKKIG